jgi:urease accessory protein
MLRAVHIAKAATWETPAADRVVLDYEARCRRRVAMTGVGGIGFLLDLSGVGLLLDGDGLVLEDGRIIQVEAARENLVEITCDDPVELVRIAWHLGNRHLATEMHPDRLLVRYDHVIAEMLRGLGARVATIQAPFNPEGGAYAADHHAHGDDHQHHSGSHG